MKKIKVLAFVLCMLIVAAPVFGVVAFAEDVTLPYVTKMSENLPTNTFVQDGSLTNTFQGNWTPIAYPVGSYGDASKMLKIDTLYNAGTDPSVDGFYVPSGMTYPRVRVGGNGYWGVPGSLAWKATHTVGWQYTAEYSGTVDLAFDTLFSVAPPAPIYVAVFVNGVMVWPKQGATAEGTDEILLDNWYCIANDQQHKGNPNGSDFMKNIVLKKGDTVEFMVGGAAGSTASSGNRMLMRPAVTYTSLVEAPKFSETEVALGEAFAVNLRFDAASIHAQATNLGAYINGEFVLAVDGCVRVDGIAAKNLVDEIKAAPAYTLGGTELRGEEITVTPAALLGNYVTGEYSAEVKALAAATLDYAAAAQMYFEYKSEGLEPAKKEYAYTGTYESAMKIKGNEENNVATPYAATLLLGDTVSFKFIFTAAAEGFAENYRFALLDADGKVVKTVAPVLCEGQTNTYKAIFEGIMPTMWNKVYTVAVIAADDTAAQPTAIGETVDYSVMSYLVRASAKSDNPVLASDVAPAMYALYEAAVAYLNAQK